MNLYKPANIEWIQIESGRITIFHKEFECVFFGSVRDLVKAYGDLRKYFFRYKNIWMNLKFVSAQGADWVKIGNKKIEFDPEDQKYMSQVIPPLFV